MSNHSYVFTPCPAGAGDLGALRGYAIADACARFREAGEGGVVFAAGGDVRGPGDPNVERWAQWLLAKLDAAGSLYQRSGEGWRLRTGKLYEESERRLGELSGWSDGAIAGQRKLLEHVDDPGNDGDDLEQSLSKLAAAGWSVDSKKDKKAPAIHYAAGDLPLARGEDWRAAGAVHPRLAAALGFFLAALSEDERASAADPGAAAALTERLPAFVVAGPDDAAALLDIRTIAKALRDAGGLDLPSGEPLGRVLEVGKVRLRATHAKAASGADAASTSISGTNAAAGTTGETTPTADAASASTSETNAAAGTTGEGEAQAAAAAANDPAALAAKHGADAVRFALLHAAAPEKRFRGGDDVVGYAAGFLAGLDAFAGPRLAGAAAGGRIDPDDRLRRRLAGWCDVAVTRTAENYERLDLHRATRNAITLLARIQDFDAAVTEQRGEVAGADREAVAIALSQLAQLLAPLAPEAAAALWQAAGRDGAPTDAPWPQAPPEPAAAA